MTLARSSAAALAARLDATPTALASLAEVLDLWAQLGNEALQWWVLGRLVGLLAALGADQDGAVLAGAVLAANDHRPIMPSEIGQVETTLPLIRPRLGPAATNDAVAAGAGMGLSAAVAHARRSIDSIVRAAPGRDESSHSPLRFGTRNATSGVP